jgi:hypothetical protein
MATFFCLRGCNKVAKTPLRNSFAICSRFGYFSHPIDWLDLVTVLSGNSRIYHARGGEPWLLILYQHKNSVVKCSSSTQYNQLPIPWLVKIYPAITNFNVSASQLQFTLVIWVILSDVFLFVSEDMLKNRRQYFNMQICTTELKKLSPFKG